MSLAQYNILKAKGELPKPDYETTVARDAHDIGSHGQKVKHSNNRYGEDNECPPVTYYLSKGVPGNHYKLYIEDNPGTRTIDGPDGTRISIAIHQWDPRDSQGCFTTCSGSDTKPVDDLYNSISDLEDPSQSVRILIYPREVEELQ